MCKKGSPCVGHRRAVRRNPIMPSNRPHLSIIHHLNQNTRQYVFITEDLLYFSITAIVNQEEYSIKLNVAGYSSAPELRAATKYVEENELKQFVVNDAKNDQFNYDQQRINYDRQPGFNPQDIFNAIGGNLEKVMQAVDAMSEEEHAAAQANLDSFKALWEKAKAALEEGKEVTFAPEETAVLRNLRSIYASIDPAQPFDVNAMIDQIVRMFYTPAAPAPQQKTVEEETPVTETVQNEE